MARISTLRRRRIARSDRDAGRSLGALGELKLSAQGCLPTSRPNGDAAAPRALSRVQLGLQPTRGKGSSSARAKAAKRRVAFPPPSAATSSGHRSCAECEFAQPAPRAAEEGSGAGAGRRAQVHLAARSASSPRGATRPRHTDLRLSSSSAGTRPKKVEEQSSASLAKVLRVLFHKTEDPLSREDRKDLVDALARPLCSQALKPGPLASSAGTPWKTQCETASLEAWTSSPALRRRSEPSS